MSERVALCGLSSGDIAFASVLKLAFKCACNLFEILLTKVGGKNSDSTDFHACLFLRVLWASRVVPQQCV